MKKWKSERIRWGIEKWVDTKPKHTNEDINLDIYLIRSHFIIPVTVFTQIAKHDTLHRHLSRTKLNNSQTTSIDFPAQHYVFSWTTIEWMPDSRVFFLNSMKRFWLLTKNLWRCRITKNIATVIYWLGRKVLIFKHPEDLWSISKMLVLAETKMSSTLKFYKLMIKHFVFV